MTLFVIVKTGQAEYLRPEEFKPDRDVMISGEEQALKDFCAEWGIKIVPTLDGRLGKGARKELSYFATRECE